MLDCRFCSCSSCSCLNSFCLVAYCRLHVCCSLVRKLFSLVAQCQKCYIFIAQLLPCLFLTLCSFFYINEFHMGLNWCRLNLYSDCPRWCWVISGHPMTANVPCYHRLLTLSPSLLPLPPPFLCLITFVRGLCLKVGHGTKNVIRKRFQD